MARMTKARIALFAQYPWCDEAQQKSLHKQLDDKATFEKLLKWYADEMKFTGNKDTDGNLILKWYLDRNSPEQAKARLDKMAAKAEARNKYFTKFQETFGRSLRDFWENNYLGFDCVKFDDEVVKSNDGESTHDAIKRQWGDAALYMIKQLMGTDTI